MSEVTTAAKELIEDIERASATSSPTLAALFVLFHAFCSMSVVDLAQFLIGKRLVGFADFDKFLGRCLIFGVLIGVVFLREAAVCLFQIAFIGGFIESQDLPKCERRIATLLARQLTL